MADILLDKEISPIPAHVAIIMDGNGRWAKARAMPRLEGHRAGTENVRRVLETFYKYQVKYITIYAFSTENWERPQNEVSGLMQILSGSIERETKNLHDNGVKIRHLGRLDRLSEKLQQQIQSAIELTKNNTEMVLSVAIDYGGRSEIVDVIKNIIREGLSPETVDEKLINKYLYSTGLPDPDLIIRTGGEMRLSNFLLWQSAYSEFYSTPITWPEFGEKEIRKALLAYSKRERIFGGWRQ